MNPINSSWGSIDPSSFHCLIDISEEIELLWKNVHSLVVHSRLSTQLTERMLIEDLIGMVIFQINMIPSMPFHPMQTAGAFDNNIFPIEFREDLKETINEEFLSTLQVQQYFHPNPDDHTQISMYCLAFYDQILDHIEQTLQPMLPVYPQIRQFYHIDVQRKPNQTTIHMHFHWPPPGDSRENPFER